MFRKPLEKLVEIAVGYCPEEADQIELIDPKSPVIVEFRNLTCKQAFDVFTALDIRFN